MGDRLILGQEESEKKATIQVFSAPQEEIIDRELWGLRSMESQELNLQLVTNFHY